MQQISLRCAALGCFTFVGLFDVTLWQVRVLHFVFWSHRSTCASHLNTCVVCLFRLCLFRLTMAGLQTSGLVFCCECTWCASCACWVLWEWIRLQMFAYFCEFAPGGDTVWACFCSGWLVIVLPVSVDAVALCMLAGPAFVGCEFVTSAFNCKFAVASKGSLHVLIQPIVTRCVFFASTCCCTRVVSCYAL